MSGSVGAPDRMPASRTPSGTVEESPISFVRLWFTGYYRPVRMIEQLRTKPAPQWGFYGAFLRAGLDALLLYLPLALMGFVPPMPSNLAFLPTEQYYWHLIWLTPIVLGAQWLITGSFTHVVLRLSGRQSDFDQVLNLYGMSNLVVGAFILLWDWSWVAVGGVDQYFLGISHLAISLWGAAIETIGLKRLLSVPTWLAATLSILTIPTALPLGIMFMRSPL